MTIVGIIRVKIDKKLILYKYQTNKPVSAISFLVFSLLFFNYFSRKYYSLLLALIVVAPFNVSENKLSTGLFVILSSLTISVYVFK